MVEGCKEIRDEMIMKMKENLKENEKNDRINWKT